MGLAASQARLLTITSRRSDCEYQSMDLSHQKIALSRDMNIVSAEYQDALNKTKLVYDYYGTGDKTTQLSYDLLMSPSKLNNYLPSPVTDPSGRIVLDANLAAAARAAGIPQEGLGCTPSSDLRDRFIDSLAESGAITRSVANSVLSVPYNPKAGIGEADIPMTKTRTITFADFIHEFLENETYNFHDLTRDAGGSHLKFRDKDLDTGSVTEYDAESMNNTLEPVVTFAQLLENKLYGNSYSLYGTTWDTKDIDEYGGRNCIIDKVGTSNFWDVLFNTLESRLSKDDTMAQSALAYAKQQTLAKVISLAATTEADITNRAYSVNAKASGWFRSDYRSQGEIENQARNTSDNYVGYVYIINSSLTSKTKYNDGYNCNMSNMTKAFYTYFAMYMEGLATTDYCVTNEKTTSNFVTDDFNAADFSFEIEEDVDTTGDSALIATFYDCLFNQIALKGWIENENVHDNEYFATMLRNGSMYLEAMDDDDYYYQKNYATFTYIKEVTDEEGIAVAEAKYMREKEKINSKENILDMKLKNLDTEITALNTEYDTVKSVITNNVKTGFTRYKA